MEHAMTITLRLPGRLYEWAGWGDVGLGTHLMLQKAKDEGTGTVTYRQHGRLGGSYLVTMPRAVWEELHWDLDFRAEGYWADRRSQVLARLARKFAHKVSGLLATEES